MSERNPDHPVTRVLHDQWHKLLAIVMWKLRVHEITLAEADVQGFTVRFPDGSAVVAHDTRAGLRLILADPKRADQFVEMGAVAGETPAPPAPPPPADRAAKATVNGTPFGEHLTIDPHTGMQRDYIVLTAEERAKGFVRPVRYSYQHIKCGTVTTMGRAIAETYARDPAFYGGTMCVNCRAHFPVGESGEFVWEGTTEKVGT